MDMIRELMNKNIYGLICGFFIMIAPSRTSIVLATSGTPVLTFFYFAFLFFFNLLFWYYYIFLLLFLSTFQTVNYIIKSIFYHFQYIIVLTAKD